jgi:hypothetical protein
MNETASAQSRKTNHLSVVAISNSLEVREPIAMKLVGDVNGNRKPKAEGVMGLRRGFIQAGAQNLLMTLWPISDETTVQIVREFYNRALASGNAAQSLLEVQRDWLVKRARRRDYFTRSIVRGHLSCRPRESLG